MSATCACDGISLANSGQPGCVPIAKAQKKIIIVPYYDSTGTINYINTAVTLNAAFFLAKINHADPSKRFYVLPEVKNVTDEKADSVFEEFEDNTKAFIKEGVRTFAGMIIKGSYALLGALKSYKCQQDLGVFIIDNDGNIIGANNTTGLYLNPIRLESSSWDAKLVKSTDTTIQKILLGFQFHISEQDENLRMLTPEDMPGVSPLTFSGLLTVYANYINNTDDLTTVQLYVNNGAETLRSRFPVKGLVTGDFALYNTTTDEAVVITTFTESTGTPKGIYVLEYAAQTAGDILRLTITKNGYDFSNVTIYALE